MKKFILCIFTIFNMALFGADSNETYSHKDCKNFPLDWKLVEILDRREGVFIEAGAFDGLLQSNTKLLEEKYGWHGILIEPNPNLLELLKKNRPTASIYGCALGKLEQNNTYLMGDFHQNSPMCSIDGVRLNARPSHRVLTRSLQSILDELEVTHVDFMSLDTEGYEYTILQGIDYNKTTFDYLLIEIYTIDYESIVTFLDLKGYEMINNLSSYNIKDNPHWDRTHNDYLFKRKVQ